MPFALGFILLLLLRSGRLVPRTISVVSAISLLSLGLMVWVNAVRYAFGLTYNELPLSLANPALSPLRLGIAGIAGGLLVVVSGYLVVRMWRPEDRLPAGPEPALASTALPVTTPDPSAR